MSTAPNNPPYLQPYAASYIADFAGNAEHLRQMAEQNEHAIGRVLSRLLDNPALPLSILGCPQQERLPMVWGLHMAADGYLNDRGYPRAWSFSTHEVSHDDSIKALPEIVFLPEKPLGAGVVNRTIVDLDAVPAASENGEVAGKLLASLFHGTPPPVPKPVRESVYATSGASGFGDPAFGDPAAMHPKQVHVEPRSGAHAAAQPPQPRRAEALLRARSVHDFERELYALEDLTKFAGNRQQLRAELDLPAMDTISAFVERKARLELFDRLLKITYGPLYEDIGQGDGLEHATKLASQSNSDLLSLMLGRAAAGRRNGPVRDTAIDRAANGARPAGHAAPRPSTRKMRRNQLLLSIAVVVLLLGIVFLLGYLVGRPSAATQDTAPTTTAAPAGPPVQTPAPPAGPTSTPSAPAHITVEASADPNQVIFAFVLYQGALYPQGPCTLQDDASWTCTQTRLPQGAKILTDTKLQAFRVPQADEGRLKQAAAENKSVQKEQGWGNPLPEQR
jgi:hypothetical protein